MLTCSCSYTKSAFIYVACTNTYTYTHARTRTRKFTHTNTHTYIFFCLSLSITCEQVHTEIACSVLFQANPYFAPVQQPVAALKETETQVQDLLTVTCVDPNNTPVTVWLESTVPSSPCGTCFQVYPRCGGGKRRQAEMLHDFIEISHL